MNTPKRQAPSFLREYDLSQWLKAMRRLIAWRDGEYGNDALSAFVAVWVELLGRRRELGVFDQDRISETAAVFGLAPEEVAPVWQHHKARAEDAYARNRRAAERALDHHTDSVTVSRLRLIDGMGVARAFDITLHVKRNAFSARVIGHSDGSVIKTPRLRTRLPTLVQDQPVVSLSHTSVSLRTRAERQAICARLGWKADTLSKAARTKTAEEFDAWIAKREAETWPRERLEGRKLPGESDWHATKRLKDEAPKTRNRERGVTAARRELAALTGHGLSKTKTDTAGWTMLQIDEEIARKRAEVLSRLTRYGCHVRPDNKRENTPIVATSLQIDVSRSRDISKRNAQIRSGKQAERDKALPAHIRSGMADWYREKHGRELKPATIRQWRGRGRLEAIVFAVEAWMYDREWSETEVAHHLEGEVRNADAVGYVRAADTRSTEDAATSDTPPQDGGGAEADACPF